MNFDFSDEQKQLRDEARKYLAEKCPPKAVRTVLDGKQSYDRELWKGLAEMGFLGVAIPEKFGGAGAGHLELCVIAEEMGRALAPVPFSSTVYLAAEAILLAGSEAQQQKWLPLIASGDAIGTLARREIEERVGKKVFLQTFVKVRPNWRQDPEFLAATDWRGMAGT